MYSIKHPHTERPKLKGGQSQARDHPRDGEMKGSTCAVGLPSPPSLCNFRPMGSRESDEKETNIELKSNKSQ